MQTKTQLRKQLRARRKTLSPQQQQRHARQFAKRFSALPAYRNARHIAVYLASNGEADAADIIRRIAGDAKRCYLPAIDEIGGPGHMCFRRYRPGQTLVKNAFGLGEPGTRQRTIAPQQIDIVIVPLVGFDRQGGRLGMGGGYYDRSFAFKRQRSGRLAKPLMIALAHSLQEVPLVPTNRWDVPMDMVITERRCLRLSRQRLN